MKTKSTLKFTLTAIAFVICTSATAQIGTLDPSFSTDGRYILDIDVLDQDAYGIAIQSDGKIVLAVDHDNGADMDAVVVRLNTDGTLDNTFDTDGIVIIDLGGEDLGAYDVAIQADGKIVIAGYYYGGPMGDFMVARLNTDGTLDNTFNSDGVATVDIAGTSDDEGISLAIQADGQILLVGFTDNGVDGDVAVVRFDGADGLLDFTFDGDGILTYDSGFDELSASIAEQTDGKIVISGYLDKTTDVDVAVIRLDSDGSFDNTFDTDGIVLTDIAGDDDEGMFLSLQADGKILVASTTYGGTSSDFAILRYNTDGSLDASFDTDGIVLTDFGGGDDYGYSVIEQTDGKIVAVGSAISTFSNFAVARYNSDGSADATFGTGGKVTTSMPGGDSEIYRLALQIDGKIVVTGYVYDSLPDHTNIAVARYVVTDNSGFDNLTPENVLAAYPNPFNDHTMVTFGQTITDGTLAVRNILGQEICVIKDINGEAITFDRNTLPSGIYFLDLNQTDVQVGQIRLIVAD